jgi:CubicO group peptidase (beta-lactamase class C family)
MTVRDLLTMSSGLACDDGDQDSPGNEETMQEQTEELDWYRYAATLPMVAEPGEQAHYCSATANLLGAVMAKASHQSLPRLLHERLAEPLEVSRYHLFLTPTGDAYMGGGIHWLPRDFLKFGQLMLNGGRWNGRQVLTEEWAAASVSRQVQIDGRDYGYLWWLYELPYQGRSVSVFFAGGNGGQVVLGIPELDLIIGFLAGNYSDSVALRIVDELIPTYILPALGAPSERP